MIIYGVIGVGRADTVELECLETLSGGLIYNETSYPHIRHFATSYIHQGNLRNTLGLLVTVA